MELSLMFLVHFVVHKLTLIASLTVLKLESSCEPCIAMTCYRQESSLLKLAFVLQSPVQ